MERPKVLIPVPSITSENGVATPINQNIVKEKLLSFGMDGIEVLPESSLEEQERLINITSGVLIPGGPHFHPESYGEIPDDKVDYKQARKDIDDLQKDILEQALDNGKPALGICRGLQAMVIVTGGKLIQHLPSVTDELHGLSMEHPDRDKVKHPIILEPGTEMYEIFNGRTLNNTPSRHEQEGRGGEMIIAGWSPEGIVEAVEMPRQEHSFFKGIQSHGELVNDTNPLFYEYGKAVLIWHQNNQPFSNAA